MPDDFSVPELALELADVVRAYQASVDGFDRETARAFRINETDLRCGDPARDLPPHRVCSPRGSD
jgi:hypothetical protein